MPNTSWRAAELPIPNGSIVLDVTGAGRFTQYRVTFQRGGGGREIGSLDEPAQMLGGAGGEAESLAAADPTSFARVVFVLSNRSHHIFPRESMWPELERHFALRRADCEPRISAGRFQFVAYSRYVPVIELSRLIVDLRTLQVTEEPLVSAPLASGAHGARCHTAAMTSAPFWPPKPKLVDKPYFTFASRAVFGM